MKAAKLRAQVEEALEASGHSASLAVHDVIPELRIVVLSCAVHGQFSCNAHRVINPWGREYGLRCKQCEDGQQAGFAPTFSDLVRRARECGLEPEFEEASLGARVGSLRLRCAKNHLVLSTERAIGKQGCQTCREEDRVDRAYMHLRSRLEEKGYKLVTTRHEFRDGLETVSYTCGHCGEVLTKKLSKALRGAGHGCKRKLGQGSRRSRKYQELLARSNRVGIRVLTPEKEYEGVKGKLLYWDGSRSLEIGGTGVSLERRLVLLETRQQIAAEAASRRGAANEHPTSIAA